MDNGGEGRVALGMKNSMCTGIARHVCRALEVGEWVEVETIGDGSGEVAVSAPGACLCQEVET